LRINVIGTMTNKFLEIKFEVRESLSEEESKKNKKSSKITDEMMTQFEYSALLQRNAKRIKFGGEIKVDDWKGPFDPISIAKLEIEQRVAPFVIVRLIPDGSKRKGYYEEIWHLKHMDIRDC
jgi:hypothetical protein